MKIVINQTIKALIITLLSILIASFIINLLYYFDIIGNSIIRYIKMICLIFSFFLGGFYMGKHSPNKGYLYGLRLSIILIIIFLILGIICNNIGIKQLIYYIITMVCVTFGSMIGINKKGY